jgi:hypothetical protein
MTCVDVITATQHTVRAVGGQKEVADDLRNMEPRVISDLRNSVADLKRLMASRVT